MHGVIIGGGIAGPLAAIGLRANGHDATVYEAHGPEGGAIVGAWLTVAVNGFDAMAALGVDGPVRAQGFGSQEIELVSGTGKLLGAVPIGAVRLGGASTRTLRRAALYGTIADLAAARGVEFVHGRRLVGATQDGAGVHARFDDGTVAHGDLLVGADGVHSRVRGVLDDAAPQPRFSGLLNFGGFTPPQAGLDLAPGVYRMVFGRRAFFGYTVADDGEIWWFVNLPRRRPLERSELAATTDAAWTDLLVDALRDDVGPMVAILRATAGPIVVSNQYELPTVPTWHRGRMTILGDAAHAASPSSGQGVPMAAEDAAVLAHCLRDASDIDMAFAAFEARRRARVERVVAHGARMNSSKTAGPIGRTLRDLVLPTILRRIARQAHDGAMAWLFEHHVDPVGLANPDAAR
jgi:FAD-dependent urate hydroxylase